MGELIRIGAPGLSATVETTGAWVTELSDGRKDHILFPRETVPDGDKPKEPKFRGGMHVCAPYFGRDPEGSGPQHGFSRDVEWEIIKLRKGSVVLRHTQDSGDYAGLIQRLELVAAGRTFVANLVLQNRGDTGIEIAPGFHPYFAGPSENDQIGSVPRFEQPRPGARGGHTVQKIITLANGLRIALGGQNAAGVVTWSDNPAEYHCIEPVSTKSFSEDGIPERRTLGAGKESSCLLAIDIEDPTKRPAPKFLLNLR